MRLLLVDGGGVELILWIVEAFRYGIDFSALDSFCYLWLIDP
jgi:hypothetical protein